MGVFLLKRFATFLVTLAVASVLVFGVLELLPGNAAEVILGDTATPESLASLQAKLGLDRPPLQRYTDWVGGLLQGRTAQSISYDTPTAELIAERMRVTLPLAVLSMALTVVLALALAGRGTAFAYSYRHETSAPQPTHASPCHSIPSRLHPRRALGGDRHHRHARRPAPAGRAERPRGGATDGMRQ